MRLAWGANMQEGRHRMAITRETILETARSLPPAARVFSELGGLLRDPKSRIEDVATVIKRDATLAAHVIRVSNSVVYRGEQSTGSVEEALGRVGLEEIWRLVGHVSSAQLVDRPLKHYGLSAQELRDQMLETAFVCEALAVECGQDPRSAYTAGLMRPLGLLVIDRLADAFKDLRPYHPVHDKDFLAWEGRAFGLASCEVAALVLGEWSFRADIVEAVRCQYFLRAEDRQQALGCLVNLAGGLVADAGHALLGETAHWGVTPEKLGAIGLTPEKFQAAGKRARAALEAFQQRLGRIETDLSESEDKPFASQTVAVVLSYDEAMANPKGSTRGGSCNFPVRVRVLQTNDAPPVQTHTPGLITPTDFTTFMRSYQDMVYSTAYRLTGNETQAEDISQEVFLKAYERFDSLQASPTAGGWLKTVATNLSLNHLSRYRNRWRFFSEFRRDDGGGEDDQPEVEFAAPDTFFAGMDAGEKREWVERALDELPEHQRVPLVLFHFEDMPYDEIAKRLGVSLAKVKTDILRARAALAQILARSGASHEKFTA